MSLGVLHSLVVEVWEFQCLLVQQCESVREQRESLKKHLSVCVLSSSFVCLCACWR